MRKTRNSRPRAESPILLCAALGVEARACRAGLARVGARARAFEILTTGMGPVNARATLSGRLARADLPRPRCIISTGFAGSLVQDLLPYDWILGTRIGNRELREQPALRLLADGELIVKPVSVSSPDSTAQAVDLESETLAELAAERGIPFQLFRLISDSPSFPLPEAIRRFSRGEALAALGSAVREPLGLGRYVLGAAKLPKALERGWISGAQAFSDPEFLEIVGREHSA